MTSVAEQIVRVAAAAGVAVDEELAERQAAFIGLLAKWNETLNLTGFALSPPADEAVLRLVVEPLAAGPLIPSSVRLAIDVGSGGGSPALPLKLLRPEIQFVLVESKSRKCAFLREACRHLELTGVEVVNERLEDAIRRPAFQSSMDLVTVRAVRLDEGLAGNVRQALKPEGHVLFFGTSDSAGMLPASLESVAQTDVKGSRARLVLARQR